MHADLGLGAREQKLINHLIRFMVNYGDAARDSSHSTKLVWWASDLAPAGKSQETGSTALGSCKVSQAPVEQEFCPGRNRTKQASRHTDNVKEFV
jgi:hypothetical protein